MAMSTNELPTISLSGGYGLNPDQKATRRLEATPLQYSYMYPIATVQADFGELYYEKNGIAELERNQTLMIVTISSNETGFIEEYEQWEILSSFNCHPSYCSFDNSPVVKYRSVWTKGNAQRINLNIPISVANGAWQLRTSALYNKLPEMINFQGIFGVGWIGLGTGLEASKNFQTENPIFSIVYDKISDTGNLIFGFNSSLADKTKPSMTVTTSPNWEMRLASMSVGDESVYFVNGSQDLSMIFDLNCHEFYMPKEIITNIVNKLSQYATQCVDVSCTSKTLEGLPQIIFTLSDNTNFSLSPEIYMKKYTDAEDGSIKYYTRKMLNQRFLEDWPNRIVFGRGIMAHYYSVFQQTNHINTITLYSLAPNTTIAKEIKPSTPKQPEIPSSESSHIDIPSSTGHVIFIIVGICVGIIFVFLCAKIVSQRRQAEIKHIHQHESNIELNRSEDGIPLKVDP